MKSSSMSKLFGILTACFIMMALLGYVFLQFIGMGLADSLNSGDKTSISVIRLLLPSVLFLCLAFITAVGPFKIKRNREKTVFMIYSLVFGISLLAVFVVTSGALGTILEYLIFCLAVSYLLLAYCLIKDLNASPKID